MTRYYLVLRHLFYEHCSQPQLKKRRTFSQMKTLYLRIEWGIKIIQFLCLIFFAIALFTLPSQGTLSISLGFITLAIFAFVCLFQEMLREKYRFQSPPRILEIDAETQTHQAYIKSLSRLLEAQGVYHVNQIELLMDEAHFRLQNFEYQWTPGRLNHTNVLVYLPLSICAISIFPYVKNQCHGALPLSLCYTAFLFALSCYGTKSFAFYACGIFKDQRFLNVMKELIYENGKNQ